MLLKIALLLQVVFSSLAIASNSCVDATRDYLEFGSFDSKLIWSDLLLRAGYESPQKTPENIWEFLGVDLKSKKEIVLVNLNPNLGDNIISQHPVLFQMQKKFPDAKVTFVDATARLLQKTEWLSPVPLDLKVIFSKENLEILEKEGSSIEFSKILQEQVRKHLSEDSVLIMEKDSVWKIRDDLGSFLEAAYGKESASGIVSGGSSKHSEIRRNINEGIRHFLGHFDQVIQNTGAIGIMIGGRSFDVSIYADRNYSPPPHLSKAEESGAGRFIRDQEENILFGKFDLNPLKKNGEPLFFEEAVRKRYVDNLYLRSFWTNSLFYGPNVKMSLPSNAYLKKGASSDLASFRREAFSNPEAPFIVISLNTKGALKFDKLHPYYVQRIKNFIEVIGKRYEQFNILIEPPEIRFGPEIINEVQHLVSSLGKGKVALLPENAKHIWDQSTREAFAVITEDSGFSHIASIHNKNVFTASPINHSEGVLGREYSMSSSEAWHRPGTAFGWSWKESAHGEKELDADALKWLDDLIERNHQPFSQ